MQDAHQSEDLSHRARAVAFRDGLVIALLAFRPLRLRNFASLQLGYHLHRTFNGYRIEIPGEETKTGRAIEKVVPEEIEPWLELYLNIYRPLLLKGNANAHLWISKDGLPYSPRKLGERVAEITERRLGVRIPPHFFRDCAATTVATADPEHVRIIAPLLDHSTPVTAELYYNHARAIEAGRTHQQNLRQLRQRLAPVKRRTARNGKGTRCAP
jgi:integrase